MASRISNFRSFSAFKISYFCQKRCLTSFSPSGKVTKWAQFVFARKIFRKLFLSRSYLSTKALFFQVFQHFRRKLCCRHHLLALLLANGVKRSRWVSYTFLQKRCSFKSFSILEENCAAEIISGTFKCKSFVGKCCKKRPLSKLYLPTKALFFQVFQHFRRKLWYGHHSWNI